jgi:hypothetical protein
MVVAMAMSKRTTPAGASGVHLFGIILHRGAHPLAPVVMSVHEGLSFFLSTHLSA